jgi:ABC-2 type transport system permease protein
MAGLAVLLVGWLPKPTALAWALLGYAFLAACLGRVAGLPGWAGRLTPFGHVPQLPVEPFAAAPLIGLTAAAAGLAAAGLARFRVRDLG